MVGLGECRGDYVPGAAAEHKTKETLGRFVEVARKCQTFIERWFGRPQNYRLSIHTVFLSRTAFRRIRIRTAMSERVDRASDPSRAAIQHMGVDHRCLDILVAQELLNRPDIVAVLK